MADDDDDSKPLLDLSAYTRKIPSNFDSGRPQPGADPTPDNPHARQKARNLPRHLEAQGGRKILLGEQPRLPNHTPERPEMTENPQGNVLDPVTISLERPPIKPDYAKTAVRRVVPAEIDWLIEWGLPRFQHRFPRCTPQSIWGVLNLGCQGGNMYFVRTESACGLFIAEMTPWEPELAVYDVFVVKKRDAQNEDERDAIYRAGLRWAEEIGAVTYQYGASTGVKLDKVAEKIGYDFPVYSYIKVLR